MKALVKEAPGLDNMVYTDISEPAVKGDLVKIKVAYTGICGTDIHAFKGTYPSTKTPVVLGYEFSGIVSEIGPEVKKIKTGDRVTSETTFIAAGGARLALAKECGAARVIDQDAEDIDLAVKEMTGGNGVDIAFECSGAVAAANKALQTVKRKGKVIQMGVFPEEKALIFTDLILHREISYIGSRSQKPSSWRIALSLMRDGTVRPDRIVSSIVSLEDWRSAFESMSKGEGVKSVICCDETVV